MWSLALKKFINAEARQGASVTQMPFLQFIEKLMNLSLWKPMETDETIRTIVTNSTDSIVFKFNTYLFCTNANQYHINLIPIFVNVVPTFHRNPLTEKKFHMSQWYVCLQIALYHSENAVGVFQSNLIPVYMYNDHPFSEGGGGCYSKFKEDK